MSKDSYDIEFIPGSFDDFEGTQEELDSLVAEIKNMAASGELLENAKTISLEELKETNPDIYEILVKKLETNNKGHLN